MFQGTGYLNVAGFFSYFQLRANEQMEVGDKMKTSTASVIYLFIESGMTAHLWQKR